MPLNPFFLQGSYGEQTLVQDLINEQLRMYGIEVYYLPRKIFSSDNILKEVESSKFDDSFLIEAYLNNYEGYAPGSDIMTKFGLQLKNEVTLTISRERFEESISPFLEGINAGVIERRITEYDFGGVVSRPKEGDLIFFPLGERLFEIKRVEFEKPFYQLNKNYTYELQCELYEYENEIIDTQVDEIDYSVEDEGYMATVILSRESEQATAEAIVGGIGMVGKIILNDDGSGYTTAPTVTISSPNSSDDITAKAVAVTTSVGGSYSIDYIKITNPGSGYTSSDPPTVTISGGNGVGAAATALIVDNGLSNINVLSSGDGYNFTPTVTISSPESGTTATAEVTFGTGRRIDRISDIFFTNTGAGYTSPPDVTIEAPPSTGTGEFVYGEFVTGQTSGTKAMVRDFRTSVSVFAGQARVTTLSVAINSGSFLSGEVVVGETSGASYIVESYNTDNYNESFDSNKDIETEADSLLDFTESNPFGDY